jgi:ectoine hydroxylase-related dioxygenase (phytanoyl-CoA dioxygenase family)
MHGPGYSITEEVLSSRECDVLTAALANGERPRMRAGARNLMRIPEIAALARDDRLLQLAAEVLGGRAVPFRATLFAKSGRANWLVTWHRDTALPLVSQVASDEWGPWSTKAGVLYARAPAWALERVVALRVHLDASTNENGPLRVIAGSHRAGVLSDAEVLATAHRHTAVECVVGRGGVVAMRPLLIHASSKARLDQPRRVIHIEYRTVSTWEAGPIGRGLTDRQRQDCRKKRELVT